MPDSARALGLQRLFQLASPALPVGAFAYSEGLETAVARGRIQSAAAVEHWLAGTLEYGVGQLDLPVFFQLYAAWKDTPEAAVKWSRFLMAARETAERRAQERHLGRALAALLDDLGFEHASAWRANGVHAPIATFAALYALAAVQWAVAAEDAAAAFAWSWLENQVLAAVKLVPLGQTAGQRALANLGTHVPDIVERARLMPADDISGALPAATLLCVGHETLYSRLFRS